MNTIVLLTDFGNSEYVGVMKGVCLKEANNIPLNFIDLTHQIPPQDVRSGAWVLATSYSYFPPNSIFLCVVDPGVGTERDALVIKTTNYYFIGPDNGLMYPAAISDGIISISRLQISSSASTTFHGRDVFAKAAGKIVANNSISNGMS